MPPDAASSRALLPEVHYTLALRDHPGAWQVRRVELREALSAPYSLRIELLCEDPELDPNTLLGADARLTLTRADEHRRDLLGLVLRVEQLGRRGERRALRLEIGPALALSAHRVDTRAWQQQSALQIVQAVLAPGLAALGRRLRLDLDQADIQPREYCVQYRESDLDFIRRLLHEEGLAFRFEHTGDAETLVLLDSTLRCPELGPFPLLPRAAVVAAAESVERLDLARALGTTGVIQRDWVALLAADAPFTHTDDHRDPRGRQRLRFDHDDRRVDADDGARRARHKQGRHAAAHQLARGASDILAFCPGQRFTLGEPAGDYLLLGVEHHGDISDAPAYHNTFVCQPAALPLRPFLDDPAPRPRVHGPHTAIVIGPEGEEIHTDEHGRIKLRFHWDSQQGDEHGSCWVRVAQTWAGPGWGALFIPRVGMEVVVQFLDGDPDRPLVVGCVYNSLSTPPLALPDHKTCSALVSESTPGGGLANQIRLEDARGRESLTLKTRRDLHTTAGHDHSATVANNHTTHVGANHITTVGANHITTVADHCDLTVSSGHLSTTVLAGHSRIDVLNGAQTLRSHHQARIVSTHAFVELLAETDLSATATTGAMALKADQNVDITSEAAAINLTSATSVNLNAMGLNLAMTARTLATLEATEGPVAINAGTQLFLKGKSLARLSADTVLISADQCIELSVGGTSLKLTAGAIELSSPAITSKAIGEHIIAGALIRLN